MKIFLQKVSPFLSLALWLAAQGLYVQVHCTQLGAQLRFKILVIWLNTWTPTPWKLNMVSQHDVLFFWKVYHISNPKWPNCVSMLNFMSVTQKIEYSRWKKTHLKPPSFLWIHPFQEDAFVMDVAWLQRDSFHTLELSVQDTDFRNRQNHQIFKLHRCLFFKALKATKKPGEHLENVNYYYSIQRVFLGWDVRRSFERIFFKAVALDFQRFFVVGKLSRSFLMDPKEQQKLMLRLLSEAGKTMSCI